MSTLQLRGRLVSTRDGGEYHGPCPFYERGKDRFIYWPGKGNWLCPRWDCADCPGIRDGKGGRYGYLDDTGLEYQDYVRRDSEPRRKRPSMDTVYAYYTNLDTEARAYLAKRKITTEAIEHFLIGRDYNRVTIPNVFTRKSGTRFCLGIKKRWLKEDADWIDKYTVEPGSKTRTILNLNRLISKQWDFVVIVEGVLDCVIMDQYRIPTVAPFGGGGQWGEGWHKWFEGHTKRILIIADNDKLPDSWVHPNPPGMHYALNVATKLAAAGIPISVSLPPNNYKDMGEMAEHESDKSIRKWIADTIKKGSTGALASV
jgi:DNA primase